LAIAGSLLQLFGSCFAIEKILTCAPGGDRGWPRVVNNRISTAVGNRLFGETQWMCLRESWGLGGACSWLPHEPKMPKPDTMTATRRATSALFGRVLPRVLLSVLLSAMQIPVSLLSFVMAHAGTEFTFPIRISRNGRHFEDRDGKPFLIHGDTAWSLIAQLRLDETTHYLDRRRSQGFNSILVNLLEHRFSKNPPNNAAGEQPFLTPGDFSYPTRPISPLLTSSLRLPFERICLFF